MSAESGGQFEYMPLYVKYSTTKVKLQGYKKVKKICLLS